VTGSASQEPVNLDISSSLLWSTDHGPIWTNLTTPDCCRAGVDSNLLMRPSPLLKDEDLWESLRRLASHLLQMGDSKAGCLAPRISQKFPSETSGDSRTWRPGNEGIGAHTCKQSSGLGRPRNAPPDSSGAQILNPVFPELPTKQGAPSLGTGSSARRNAW